MSRLMILTSVVALAAATVGCGNSPGQANSLVDVGPSAVSDSSQGGGNLTTLAKGGRAGGGSGGGGTTTPPPGGGTISLVLLNSTDGQAHFRKDVTFTVSTTATLYPYVTLRCYQGGTLVNNDSNAMFDGSLDQIFTLGPTGAWLGGDADCRADLESHSSSKSGSVTVLASTSFHVYP
jgi:hypothetical protein